VAVTGIKLIVTDLDNTLLRRDKTISDYTVGVFGRLRVLMLVRTSGRISLLCHSLASGIIPYVFESSEMRGGVT
jgi:hypothetical protein